MLFRPGDLHCLANATGSFLHLHVFFSAPLSRSCNYKKFFFRQKNVKFKISNGVKKRYHIKELISMFILVLNCDLEVQFFQCCSCHSRH